MSCSLPSAAVAPSPPYPQSPSITQVTWQSHDLISRTPNYNTKLTLSAPDDLRSLTFDPWAAIRSFSAAASPDVFDDAEVPESAKTTEGVAMGGSLATVSVDPLCFLAGCWGSVGPSAFFFYRWEIQEKINESTITTMSKRIRIHKRPDWHICVWGHY